MLLKREIPNSNILHFSMFKLKSSIHAMKHNGLKIYHVYEGGILKFSRLAFDFETIQKENLRNVVIEGDTKTEIKSRKKSIDKIENNLIKYNELYSSHTNEVQKQNSSTKIYQSCNCIKDEEYWISKIRSVAQARNMSWKNRKIGIIKIEENNITFGVAHLHNGVLVTSKEFL